MDTTAQANIALVRQWVAQVWNGGDLDSLLRFHPAQLINHGQPATVEDMRQWHLRTRATFPDLHYTVDDIFAASDQVALRWTVSATHRGTLWGMIPPTGKLITWQGIHMVRVADGQIVEIWALADTITQLQQMGVTLQPAQPTT